ncbi:MAG TPA: CCA tRNA nucleotidyltransferase [Nitrososphaera sp.]|nr:CCA tRNA nucleotidyltransferase [Nitrososphaera sp.]
MPAADIPTIIAKALPLCEPSENEAKRITSIAQDTKRLVENSLASSDKVTGIIFGGSFAKGTWLKNDADIDVFFKVKPSVSIEDFEKMGRSVGQQALRKYGPKLRYSDHPYVEAFVKGVRVNVVPCYDVEQGKWQSAADRSPYHTEYVLHNLDDEKKNQVRLLKKFFKSIGIYGAEISTAGFSGYVSEVLILKYGSFENVLRAAADVKERQVVAINDNYDPDIVKGFQSPIIIMDPVDIRRNLGTAISPESVGKFVLAARAFLIQPSLRFFKEEKHGRAANELYQNVLVVEFIHKERSPDVIWGQLKRTLNAMAKQLEIAGFVVLRSSCITDEKNSAVLAFLLESLILAPYATKKGPEIFRRSDTAKFISSGKRPLIMWVDKDMRVMMLVDRKVADARQFAKLLLFKNFNNSGIVQDVIVNRRKIQIYSGSERKIKGLALEAVSEIVSTEHRIFRGN